MKSRHVSGAWSWSGIRRMQSTGFCGAFCRSLEGIYRVYTGSSQGLYSSVHYTWYTGLPIGHHGGGCPLSRLVQTGVRFCLLPRIATNGSLLTCSTKTCYIIIPTQGYIITYTVAPTICMKFLVEVWDVGLSSGDSAAVYEIWSLRYPRRLLRHQQRQIALTSWAVAGWLASSAKGGR